MMSVTPSFRALAGSPVGNETIEISPSGWITSVQVSTSVRG